jgi:hypothetical protein
VAKRSEYQDGALEPPLIRVRDLGFTYPGQIARLRCLGHGPGAVLRASCAALSAGATGRGSPVDAESRPAVRSSTRSAGKDTTSVVRASQREGAESLSRKTEGVGFEPTRACARRFSRPVH